MAKSTDGDDALRERVAELEAQLNEQEETIKRLMPSRRQVLTGIGMAGAYTVGAGSAAAADTSDGRHAAKFGQYSQLEGPNGNTQVDLTAGGPPSITTLDLGTLQNGGSNVTLGDTLEPGASEDLGASGSTFGTVFASAVSGGGSTVDIGDNIIPDADATHDLGSSSKAYNAAHIGTLNADSATINGLPGVPLVDEESGSPYTATGSNSANSITPSSLDSFNSYIVLVKLNDQEGSFNDPTLQIDGETGSNYDERMADGTTITGQTEIGPLQTIGDSELGTFWFMLMQRRENHAFKNLTGEINNNAVMGVQKNTSWPPSQFTVKRGADTDWEVRVWGRDL